MIHTLIIGLIAIILAYLARYNHLRYCFQFAFLIITAFLAIRYDWGNDYKTYLEMFYDKYRNTIAIEKTTFLFNEENNEIGWKLLNNLFNPLGFFSLVIFLTCLENYILYRFIRKYVDKKWYWLAIFIYIFSPEFMLTGSSMMRQFLSMSLFLIAIEFIIKKKPIMFILIILIASTFHVSSLLLLPTYFVNRIKIDMNINKSIIIISLFIIWCIFVPGLITSKYLPSILNTNLFSKYTYYIENSSSGSLGLGFLFFSVQLIWLLQYLNNTNKNTTIYSSIFILGIILLPFGDSLPIISRLTFYFFYPSIFLFPAILIKMKSIATRNILVSLLCIYKLRAFFIFFYSDIWYDSFYIYKTIFSINNWI